MLDDIAEAEVEILLEMYWFAGRIGERFAEAMAARARDGVRVKVVYDAVGSLNADPGLFALLRAAGAEVVEFNPIAPWRTRFQLGTLNRRDHRKLLIVDGRIAYTGGVNIGDPWLAVAEGGEGFRDDMVRIEGPAAGALRRLFFETWLSFGPNPDDEVAASELKKNLPRASREVALEPPSPAGLESVPVHAPIWPQGECSVHVLATQSQLAHRAIRETYVAEIQRAKRSVYIANSYFIPDKGVRRALAEAAQRGVDVRVLVPGEIDVWAVKFASQSLYAWLMKRGVRIYEWQRTLMHAKSAVIDERFATVGTFNLDHRSVRFNLEVNVAIDDSTFGALAARQFLDDLDDSWEVDRHNWRFRPLGRRVLEWICFAFRKLL